MEEHLPQQIKQVWRIGAGLALVWWLAVTVGLLVANRLWGWPLWLIAISLGLALVHPSAELALIPYRYAFWRFRITDTAVYLKEGALFQKETAIPISRIQNVTLSAGPILRAHGLQQVEIQTASTSDSLAGVTAEVADRLRDRILALAKEARDDA
ncbi:PH domain-containing protein [Lacticaseibacillus kribbianus]|uniref:PH domain-containing protein n=1 Tax=Lacticaseibacillus kribbianus TaxID=2926292 RepID=UPI001CD4B618|nr:PH domain-containing protein [Lacticaseibacillus kribbianus]